MRQHSGQADSEAVSQRDGKAVRLAEAPVSFPSIRETYLRTPLVGEPSFQAMPTR